MSFSITGIKTKWRFNVYLNSFLLEIPTVVVANTSVLLLCYFWSDDLLDWTCSLCLISTNTMGLEMMPQTKMSVCLFSNTRPPSKFKLWSLLCSPLSPKGLIFKSFNTSAKIGVKTAAAMLKSGSRTALWHSKYPIWRIGALGTDSLAPRTQLQNPDYI